MTIGITDRGSSAEIADLGADLLTGMKEISEFWGMSERKAYHLASKGLLPGVFQMGRQWVGSKSVARDTFRAKARGVA
ncbi:hypothetical protein RZS28_00665 [Methylocapsa polymorpha]|uniref:Helix-turn-helix domain-containing protein n=1 Tax=Methylocapsa polymorpha TaxID=3080828 RepID=A0ABZ0HRD3_9HYPH|nr:hypothetical protein RZS28_00665 [Methylocapsa sp. RX1]